MGFDKHQRGFALPHGITRNNFRKQFFPLLRVQEGREILEGPGVGAGLDEVVAGADGIVGHRAAGMARRAVDHLVEGAVAAAGVEAAFSKGFRHLPGDALAVAGALGILDLEILVSEYVADHVRDLAGAVGFARRGVQNKSVLHCCSLFFF